MLYREIIAVCSQIHTKHINTLCGRNVEFDNFKPGGMFCDHFEEVKYKHVVFWTCRVSIRNEYQECFVGGKKRPVLKADNLTTILGHCHVIWEP